MSETSDTEPREFAVRSRAIGPGYRGLARSSDIPNPAFLGTLSPGRSPRDRCLLREQEGFSGAPYLIIYRGRTILIPAVRQAKCHGGIKHCLPIGAARTRTRTRPLYPEPRDIQCRTTIVIYAPPCRPLSRSSSSLELGLSAVSARSTNQAT